MIPGRCTRRVQKKQALPIEAEALMKRGLNDLQCFVRRWKSDGSVVFGAREKAWLGCSKEVDKQGRCSSFVGIANPQHVEQNLVSGSRVESWSLGP